MINKLDQYAIAMCARNEGREEGVAIGEARGEAKILELLTKYTFYKLLVEQERQGCDSHVESL
jgi:hypothetical protein